MLEGVDYSFSKPDPVQLYAAGKRFAMAYVGPGSDGKHFTRPEVEALNAAGLSCVLLVEGAADSAKGGRTVGQSHARSALDMCKARGFPTTRAFYFAVDYDLASTSWPAAREYLRGACDVLGVARVGVYGERDVMVWAQRDSVASWFFQTYAWSSGNWYAGNHVEQYHNGVNLAGGNVDLCRSKKADFGQWTLGDDMPLTPDDLIAIKRTNWYTDLDTGDRTISAGTALLTVLDEQARQAKLLEAILLKLDAAAGADHTHTVTITGAGGTGPAQPLDPTS